MEEIKCLKCGKELLKEKPFQGEAFFLHLIKDDSYVNDVRFGCKECSDDICEQISDWESKTSIDELFWYSNPVCWKKRLIEIVQQYLNNRMADEALAKMASLFVATFPFVCKEGKETWTDEIRKLFIALLEKKESKEEVLSALVKIIEDYKEVSRIPTEDEKIIANGF